MSREREATFDRVHQRYGAPFLMSAFLVSIASLLWTNLYNAPSFVFQWFVLPVFAVSLVRPIFRHPKYEGHRAPLVWLAKSIVLRIAFVYLAALVIATALRSDASTEIVLHDTIWAAKRSIEIILFLAIAAYLATIYPQFFRIVVIAIATMLVVKATIDILEFFRIPKTDSFWASRLQGAIGTPGYRNATHLAPLFSIYGLATLAFLVSKSGYRYERLLLMVALIVLFLAIVLTQARGGMAVATLGAAAIVCVSRLRFKWTVLGMMALCSAALLLSEDVRQTLFQRSDSFRFGLAEAYLRLAMEKPYLGYGTGYQIFVTLHQIQFEQPHNMYLWAQLRGGVFASVAIVALMSASGYFAFLFWRRFGNLVPLVLVLALAATGLSEIGLLVTRYDWVWLTFWLPIGLAAAAELSLKAPACQTAS